ALVSTVVAITLFFAGLARVCATRAATLSTVEPIVTVVLGALILDERITPVQVGGGALILAAVWMLARTPRADRLPGSSGHRATETTSVIDMSSTCE
ncbi:MAG: EamA family transporter, partial [Casimicrobiaceae bacterium]